MTTIKTQLEAHAAACREAIAKGEPRPALPADLRYLTDADLTGAYLAGAYLARADLAGANLARANLARADLTDANLARANLARANLARAYLARADLAGADLTDANLAGADLTDANLARANLARADLTDANLAGADLARADLTAADLTGAIGVNKEPSQEDRAAWLARRATSDAERAERYREIHPTAPVVANLDSRILAAITTGGGTLKMAQWHTCQTTHCRGGWAITLAGEAGASLEAEVGEHRAAAAIYRASTGRQPHFYASDAQALADILACAARETTP